MDAKHNSRLTKFMHFSNRLCFYGIGMIGGLFLVAYHPSATLFPDFDLLPISGTLFALIAILFFSIDRTMGPHFVTPVRYRPIGRHTPAEDSFQATTH